MTEQNVRRRCRGTASIVGAPETAIDACRPKPNSGCRSGVRCEAERSPAGYAENANQVIAGATRPNGEPDMGTEIERKFLVIGDDWRQKAGPGQPLRQGYLTPQGATSVRIRCAPEEAFLTIKGETHGLARPEFEYEIPVAEAEEMLRTLCIGPPLEKTRYRVEHGGLTWEVDVFSGRHVGLVLAEVELTEAAQHVDLPPWVGAEVTHDPRYRNAALAEGDVPPPGSQIP